MQRSNNKDDLDYLSELGFEVMPPAPGDVDRLIKQVRQRSHAGISGPGFAFLSLLAGIFIGISLFVAFYEPPPEHLVSHHMSATAVPLQPEAVQPQVPVPPRIVKDNFMAPPVAPKPLQPIAAAAEDPAPLPDPVPEIPQRPVNLHQPLEEGELKFIENAPVIYIHDLKVTDYTSLYFKRNQFVPINGVDADLPERQQAKHNGLKQSADYFLHEELDKALLAFKKGRYDQCLNMLNAVAGYNKEDINCDFYRGLCYYHKKNYRAALPLFEACIGNLNNVFLQEASYYKALCLFESGAAEAAHDLFRQIRDEGGFYAGRAKAYLE